MGDFNLLVSYWNDNPPLHLGVNHLLYGKKKATHRRVRPGRKGKMRTEPTMALNWKNESFEAMFARFTAAGGSAIN